MRPELRLSLETKPSDCHFFKKSLFMVPLTTAQKCTDSHHPTGTMVRRGHVGKVMSVLNS